MPATAPTRPHEAAAANTPPHLDSETLRLVRPQVRDILMSSEGFRKLPPDEQKQLAERMVKVAAYTANPEGLAKEELGPSGGVLARAQDAVEDTKKRLSKDPGFAGEDFEAGAIKAGVEQFGALVKKVDFPRFVSGLIQNVFQAIVDSSIQQMRAYGELLANVAKTVDQFAQDNISENNARDWLVNKFPGELGVDTESMSGGFDANSPEPQPQPKLAVTSEDPDATLKKISDSLQIAKTITDINDEDEERRLVQAARLQIARSRQQLLASMVVLGINRIVVTDGLIHAKVVFDMRASDVAKRQAKASMYDKKRETSETSASISYGSWFSPIDAGYSTKDTSEHVATVESSVDDTSESKAEVKAKLTGEVRVNFKSDYFPMEKLANPQMIAAIQGNAKPVDTTAPQPAPAAPART
jgi:hypothetical protein